MSIKVRQGDGLGSGLEASVIEPEDLIPGLVTFTKDIFDYETIFKPFLSDSFGSALNQNIAFSGSPEGVYDGTDSALWTASAISGTWDFVSTTNPNAGTKCVEAISVQDNDEALFEDGTNTDFGNFVALSGAIRLEKFSATGEKHVEARFRLNGVNVGNAVNIDDFIDVGILDSYQTFGITKANFGIASDTVDELVIRVISTGGGPAPDFRLDDLQIEAAGGEEEYSVFPNDGTLLEVLELRLVLVDGLDSTLANATIPNIAYNKLLAVSALTNGILVQHIKAGAIRFGANIKQLSDFIQAGFDIVTLNGDATTTWLVLSLVFNTPIVLDSRQEDSMRVTIQDNLAGLTVARMFARGKERDIFRIEAGKLIKA